MYAAFHGQIIPRLKREICIYQQGEKTSKNIYCTRRLCMKSDKAINPSTALLLDHELAIPLSRTPENATYRLLDQLNHYKLNATAKGKKISIKLKNEFIKSVYKF